MYNTITALHNAIQSGSTNFTDYVIYHLKQIKDNANTNAFIHVFEDEAIAIAKELERLHTSGELEWKKMTGVCISLKDNHYKNPRFGSNDALQAVPASV